MPQVERRKLLSNIEDPALAGVLVRLDLVKTEDLHEIESEVLRCACLERDML
jgi:hypothetical protein